MSVPGSPQPTRLELPDLREAHAAVVRRLRWGRLAAVGTMVTVALFLGFLATATQAGPRGLVAGLVVVLCVLALFGGLVAFSSRRERQHPGPAGPGPSSFGQVATTAPGPEVWAAVHAALARQGFGPTRTTDPNTVVATRSLSMASWGETITVRVEGTRDGRGLVTAWSRPAYPLQWLDYGANRRYANAVLTAIPASGPVA
ncbi:hypothetical protein ACOCJ4_03115 [Knoellia sp. CPCC 206435]|uniref:hypothetical protein n=1 Tax=Knoellia terrae TaxID=3404797 RepID=UPI003B42BBCC